MAKAYVFYNPLAGEGKVLEDLEALEFILDLPCVFCDMTKPETYEESLFIMEPEDLLLLCGGDGTLHRFANLIEGLHRPNKIYYYPAGEHNDFAMDFGRWYGCNPFPVTKAFRSLPKVLAGNRSIRFLTGAVFQAQRRIRRTFDVKPGYNTPATVSVTVDGSLQRFERVHFAALMHGKHCCGGMIPDPNRKRTDKDLSCVIIHGCGKLRAKYLLAQLRKGRRVSCRCLTIRRGENVHISFDTPVSILIDGEEQSDIRSFAAG